jgi:uncharacterized protein
MSPTNDTASDDTTAYARRSPWAAIPATAATVAVVIAAFVAAWLAIFSWSLALATGVLGLEPRFTESLLLTIVTSQAAMGFGGWWLAGTRGGTRRDVLRLGPSSLSVAAGAAAIVAMFAVTSTYQAIRYYGFGHDIVADMRAMAPLFAGPIWPLSFLAVALLAPLAEEMLFRGFLMSAFRDTSAGFWASVAVSTTIWTALHVQYEAPALLLVALMGVMFSLMLRWSGSLRLPLLAHALNNTVACIYLMYFLKP